MSLTGKVANWALSKMLEALKPTSLIGRKMPLTGKVANWALSKMLEALKPTSLIGRKMQVAVKQNLRMFHLLIIN